MTVRNICTESRKMMRDDASFEQFLLDFSKKYGLEEYTEVPEWKKHDPYAEMQAFYKLDDPTEEEQFRFVEAMEYLIQTAYDPADRIAFSYNLAMYYRDIKDFRLEKKYLEVAAESDESFLKEELGFLWYYGLGGEQNYEKAFQCFNACDSRKSQYMLADMYRFGQYVRKDRTTSRKIIEKLFDGIEPEANDPRFTLSTLFPEVALRYVQMNLEENKIMKYDFDRLLYARVILSIRQQRRPFWGNIRTMRDILETTSKMKEYDGDFIDIYDLLIFKSADAEISFFYKRKYTLNIVEHEGEIIYQFNQKWFHGAEDFLEKARLDHRRITTLYDEITEIKIHTRQRKL